MKKRFSQIVGLCMALIFITSTIAYPAPKNKIEFKFSHYMPITHFSHKASQMIVDEIDRRSKGSIKVHLYPAAQLYTSSDTNEAIREGYVEMAWCATNTWAGVDPTLGLFEVPFLFQSNEQLFSAIEGSLGKEYASLLSKHGVKVLAYMHYGFMDGLGRKDRLIKIPNDLKGLKMRSSGLLIGKTFQALGAAPVNISTTETYTALQRGTIDAAFTGVSSFVSRKWYEVMKYCTVVPLVYVIYPVMVNLKWWATVPDDAKKIITDAAHVGADYTKRASVADYEKSIKTLKDKGMEVYVVPTKELGKWRERTKPVWDFYVQQGGEEAKKLLNLAR